MWVKSHDDGACARALELQFTCSSAFPASLPPSDWFLATCSPANAEWLLPCPTPGGNLGAGTGELRSGVHTLHHCHRAGPDLATTSSMSEQMWHVVTNQSIHDSFSIHKIKKNFFSGFYRSLHFYFALNPTNHIASQPQTCCKWRGRF